MAKPRTSRGTPGVRPRGGPGGWALAAALAVAVAAGPSRPAAAYGVQGAHLVRLSALVAWNDGHEVLALSPVVRDVGGAGRLVVPLPPGATVAPVPPGWPPEAATGKAPAGGAGSRLPKAAPVADAAPGGARPRGRAGGRAPTITLPRVTRHSPAVRDPVHVGFLPAARLRGLPRDVFDADAAKGWRFAVVTLPAGGGPTRVTAVAFAFAANRPLLPLRLAVALPVHTLDLTVLAAGPIPDLGGMDFAVGLARAGGGPVPPALARWAKARVGLAVPVRSDFAAAAVNGPLRPLLRYGGDLTLPPPAARGTGSGAGAGAVGTAGNPVDGTPAAGPGAPAAGAPGAEGAASGPGASRGRVKVPAPPSGCGACTSAGGPGALLALAAVLVLLRLGTWRRGRPRDPCP